MKMIDLLVTNVTTSLNCSPLLEDTNVLDIKEKTMLITGVGTVQIEKTNSSSTGNPSMGLSSIPVINVSLGFLFPEFS